MFKTALPRKRNNSSSFLSSLNFTLILLAFLSVIVIIVYEAKFLFLKNNVTDEVEQVEKDDYEWNKFRTRLISSGLVAEPNENLTNFDKRVQKVVRIKVANLFNEMNDENLEKHLQNFYLKDERRYSVVLSSWRSGSSFFGDFLQSVPGTFYHYEPLINHVNMIRPPNDVYGVKRVESFLQCNFDDSSNYFQFMKGSWGVFTNSLQIRNIYEENKDIAAQPKFVQPVCEIFPFQSMKVIRLGLESFRNLLEHNKLNVKFILLVRDPRAVMNSRRILKFCMDTPDCAQPAILCRDMVDDYNSALDLTKKYPNNVKALRYEDMFSDIFKYSKKILNFYGLPYSKSTEDFLTSHTSRSNKINPFSTFRNPNETVSRWMKELKYDEVDMIQKQCVEAMKLWGYSQVDKNEYEQKKSNLFLNLENFKF